MHDQDTLLSETDLDEIRQLEESLWIAETRFDVVLMNEILAKDFFEFGRSGRTYNRAEILVEARPGQTINATIPLLNFHARLLSPGIVQVTYVSEAVYGGKVEWANRSSIWSRDGDGWKLRFHQGTPVDKSADGTSHSLSHVANAERLRSSMEQLQSGEVIERDPTEA
ncbi:nuclear transport factor 2 family protein [Rhizobium sp. Leaf262]|uniref:nuclear transport factor 2 family protein n=1 Tax=Rhizobium sp. Leaf262 TaxID=1736312 RepID=UPI00138EDC5F|nr:nuclear transport factor 2 family protein [Rhizobium sp. Leaf262]